MSGSGPSVNWSNLAKDLVPSTFQINETQARAYSPKTRTFALTERIYGELFSAIVPPLVEQATKSAQESNSSKKFSCPLDTIVSKIDLQTQRIMEKIRGKKEAKAEKKKEATISSNNAVSENTPVKRLPYGLNEIQRIACVQNAHDIAVEWFKTRCVETQEQNGQAQVKMWEISHADLNSLFVNPELFNFFYRKLNLTCSAKPVEFGIQDKAKFSISETDEDELGDATKMNGAEYALLQVGEIQAKKTIFFNPGTLPLDQLPELLTQWKYTVAEYPKDRDLVMYINKKGEITHLGVFDEKTGKVNSKLGCLQPFSHTHALFDVDPTYGTRVVFWHQPTRWKFAPIQLANSGNSED